MVNIDDFVFWINQINHPAFILDDNETIVAVNHLFCDYFETTAEKVSGQLLSKAFKKLDTGKTLVNNLPYGNASGRKNVVLGNECFEIQQEPIPHTAHNYVLIQLIRCSTISNEADEQFLETSEAILFESLFEQSPEAIVLTNMEGDVLLINKKFTEIFGYKPGELIGQKIDDHISPPEYRDNAEKLTKETASGRFVAEETQRKSKDGKIIDVSILGAPVYIKDELKFVYGIYRDITNRKQTEIQLGQSDRRFRDLFYKDKSVKLLIDPDTSLIVDANNAALNFYGYSYIAMLKQFMFDIDVLREQDVMANMQNAVKLQKNHFLLIHQLKSGAKRHVEVFSIPLQFGNKKLLYSTIYDITEKVQAEQQLRESEERYRLLAENTSDGVALFVNNIVKYISPSYYKLGFTETDLVGLSVDQLLQRIHPDDRNEIRAHMETALREKQTEVKYEYRLLQQNNSYIWIEDVVYVDYKPDGSFWSYINSRDITERKKMELSLERQKERYRSLAAEYRKNNELLKAAKEKAEASDRLKSAFLANLSHEVRTPINGISGFAQLLQHSTADRTRLHKFIRLIRQSSDRLLEIITNTMEMAKIETGQVRIYPVPIEVNDFIEELYEDYVSCIRSNKIDFNVHKPIPGEFKLLLDREKLEVTLNAILNNAVKFTPEGYITLGYHLYDDQITFYVEDSGVGVPRGSEEQIFVPFAQGDEKRDREFGGAGLGLSVAKGLVNAMGGELKIMPNEPKGTKVLIVLKTQQKAQKHYNNNIMEKHSNGKMLNVLVVEDDMASRLYISQLFDLFNKHKKQYDIFQAENAQKAREICQQNTIDLVMMDIKLPDADGLDLAKELKTHYPDQVIIAQTAFASSDFRAKSQAKGCDDFISKPVTEENLAIKLEKFF